MYIVLLNVTVYSYYVASYRDGVDEVRLPRARGIGIRSPVATDLSRKKNVALPLPNAAGVCHGSSGMTIIRGRPTSQ